MLRLAIMMWVMLSTPLVAGAWPRGKGDVFVVGYSYLVPSGTYSGIYGEWGLNDRLTFGLDLGRGVSGREKAILFLRAPLWSPGKGHRFAVELGAGRIAGRDVLRPGLSYGKGFDWAGRTGWVALDAVAEIHTETLVIDGKADLTLGLSVNENRKLMIQLQAGAQFGDAPFLRVVPSMTFAVSDRMKLEIGLSQSLRGHREAGIKAAIWLEF